MSNQKYNLDFNKKIDTIKKFYQENPPQIQKWLNGRSLSESFVICVGAGPWKIKRRKDVQRRALERLDKRDLSELLFDDLRWYPFDWQNKYIQRSFSYLFASQQKMNKFCQELACDNHSGSFTYYHSSMMTLCGQWSKVISLFCRDALKIDQCFPIDRHVERKLKELKLPHGELAMCRLSTHANILPRNLALSFATHLGIENPDWSCDE